LVAVLVLAYFAVTGAAKLFEAIKGVSLGKARLEREKARLEIHKLYYEIAALRKTHDLAEMSLADEKLFAAPIPSSQPRPAPEKLTDRLLARGGLARASLYIALAVLQLMGWSATVLLALALRFRLSGHPFAQAELYATLASAIVAVGFLFIAFRQLGPKLSRDSGMTVRVIVIASIIIALGATGYAWYTETV
jgi:hypothetical protein